MSEALRTASAQEVAALLMLKESTVCWLASQGKLPGSKVGKFWRFDLDKIERFFAQDRNGKDHPAENDAKGAAV
jgi:excisionase family DNA binding protein